MTPFFAQPLALFALFSIPLLFFIYWFHRRRHREYVVSTLIFWQLQKKASQGGEYFERFSFSAFFLLELIILILLVLAASVPMLPTHRKGKPFCVILDDSFSMRAGGKNSPRERAIRALRRLMKKADFQRGHFLVAGRYPRSIGFYRRKKKNFSQIIAHWQPFATEARLDKAINFALKTTSSETRLLVITDHAPSHSLHQGRLQWWAFGRPLDNFAFIQAMRKYGEGKEKVLFRVKNFSRNMRKTSLFLTFGKGKLLKKRVELSLKGGESKTLIFSVPLGGLSLKAHLKSDDVLKLDDEVELLSEERARVGVRLAIRDKLFRASLRRGLEATNRVRWMKEGEELLFTDRKDLKARWGRWVVLFERGEIGVAYNGPYLIDSRHLLMKGIKLDGVIWTTLKFSLRGRELISIGDVKLVTLGKDELGQPLLSFNFFPSYSNLLKTVNWPILLWNIIYWRQKGRLGLSRRNVVLGSSVSFRPRLGVKRVQLIFPDKSKHFLDVSDGEVIILAERPGLFTIQSGSRRYHFASNPLSESESSLLSSSSGKWGEWITLDIVRREYWNASWLFLLAALLLLVLHLKWMSKGPPKRWRD